MILVGYLVSHISQVNYGPAGSKQWFEKKKQHLAEFLRNFGPHEEPFLSYLPLVARERKQEEPTTPEQRESLWNALSSLDSLSKLGPIVKIMRY